MQGTTRLATLLGLLGLLACAPEPARRPRHARTSRPSASVVARCRQAFTNLSAASDREAAVRGLWSDCADLHAARPCREAFRTAADAPADVRLPLLAAGCRRGYCPRLSEPRPALCEADVATMPPGDVATAWVELERRVLERRLGTVGAAFAEAFGRLGAGSSSTIGPIPPATDRGSRSRGGSRRPAARR